MSEIIRLNNEELLQKLKKIRKFAPNIFSEVSEDYRQKIVYNLLNIARAGDQERFLWTLLRLVNARKENENAKELIRVINELYNFKLSSDMFEKWAYVVIMGIMTAKTQEGGQ